MAELAATPNELVASGRSLPVPLGAIGKGGMGGIFDRAMGFARQLCGVQ